MSVSSAGEARAGGTQQIKEMEEMAASRTQTPPVQLSELGLGREEENLLTVWYLRVRDSLSQSPIVQDAFTQELLSKIHLDLSRSQFRLDDTYVRYTAGRTKQLDDWTRDFLDRHQYEDALVLQLGCGLDNRYLRVHRGEDVKWIDVERPNVVRLRERLLQRPAGDYRLVAGVVADEADDAWLRAVPRDRPTLIVMESLLYYLDPEVGQRLFQRLLRHFGHGNIIADTLGSLAITFSSLLPTRARFRWGIDDAEDLLRIDKRLVLRDRVFTHEIFGKDHPPFFGGWTPILSLHPKVSVP